MFDQLLEGFRKASESSAQAQQDVLRQWMQQTWTQTPLTSSIAGAAAQEKRWAELTKNLLNEHRERLDAAYKSGIQLFDQLLQVSNAKSPDEYRRLTGELLEKLTTAFKEQSEAQFREFQKCALMILETANKANP